MNLSSSAETAAYKNEPLPASSSLSSLLVEKLRNATESIQQELASSLQKGSILPPASSQDRATSYMATNDNHLSNYLTTTNTNINNNNNHADEQSIQSALLHSSIASPLTFAAGKSWDEFWSHKPFPSGYTTSSITILACFITTIIFLIVVGNVLVCIAIFTEKSLKPTQNWFIASLAVSDMLLGLVVMPFSLARELMGFWIFGPLWCDIHEAMDVLLTTASINTLCLISLDRYWSITQAVNYLKKRTPKRGAFMIAFVWLFSAAVSLPPLFGWKKQSPTITVNNTVPVENGDANQDTWSENLSSQDQPESRLRRRAIQVDRSELATPILNSFHPSPMVHLLFKRNNQQHTQNGYDGESQDATLLSDDGQPFAARNSNQQSRPNTLATQPVLSAGPTSNQRPSIQATQTTVTEYPQCQLADDLGYVLYSALGSFYIPCAVMVFTYVRIFLAARSRARRAINKQTRTGAGKLNKQTAGAGNRIKANNQLVGSAASTAGAVAVLGRDQNANLEGNLKMSSTLEPMTKGKIVIVERRKSVVANAISQRQASAEERPNQPAKTNVATYTCSKLNAQDSDQDQASAMQLVTSEAKLASPSALLNADESSNNSSVITIKQQQQQQGNENAPLDDTSSQSKAASLLKAIDLVKASPEWEQILMSQEEQPSEVEICPNKLEPAVPELVVDNKTSEDQLMITMSDEGQATTTGVNTTNETCFMTLEEDSDMYEAQTGRTIMLIAGNASKRHQATNNAAKTQGIMMTMLPANSSPALNAAGSYGNQQTGKQAVCQNANCQRQMHYCGGSSLTINDEDLDVEDDDELDAIDDCDMDDDDLLTDDCNGYSVSCGLDHEYCTSARENGNNNASNGAGNTNNSCSHCQECEREFQRQAKHGSGRHLSINDSPATGAHRAAALSQHRRGHRCISETEEGQSMTADDNLSLTEYRNSQEDEDMSSMVGHDVLDATAGPLRSSKNMESPSVSKKKMSYSAATSPLNQGQHQAISSPTPNVEKKKSIGFRLARLGSTAVAIPSSLTTSGGGLLALANSQQQQQSGAAASGGRNLKALRQNFFLKLNQLTSASNKSEKKPKSSPSGKSSK